MADKKGRNNEYGPKEPEAADVVCRYCGHAWTIDVAAMEEGSDDHLKCPKCGKDGGEIKAREL